MRHEAPPAAEVDPPADSLLLRYFKGDVAKWRAFHARRAEEAAADRLRLARLVARDQLRELREAAAAEPEPVRVEVTPMLPEYQLLIAARQLCRSPAFLDALGDALLQNDNYFRPILQEVTRKPREKKPTTPATTDAAGMDRLPPKG